MEFPQTNRALRFAGIGGPLEVTETEVPPLPANELLIKVHAASINPCDIQLWRSGLVGVVAGDKGMGKDYSGTIVAVGTSVKGFKEGDEVFGLLFHVFGQGTFSDLSPVTIIFREKSNHSWSLGGTGSWLVQLAKTVYNCHVTAICSDKNTEYVQKLGTDEVIDYTRQDIAPSLLSRLTAAGQYDLLVDCVGGTDLIPAYPNLLHKTGAYVTIVGDKTDVRTLDGPITYLTCPSQVIRFLKGYFLGPRYACISFLTQSSYLEQIASLAERGEVKAEVQEVIEGAFDEREGWKRAVECMEGSHVRGKVVLAIP